MISLFRQKLVHVSPLIFAAAFGLLLIIVSVFTVQNYSREKQHMVDGMIKNSDTVSRFIFSFTRDAYLRKRVENGSQEQLFFTSLQLGIDQAGEHPDVLAIQVSNQNGEDVKASFGDGYQQKNIMLSDMGRTGEGPVGERIFYDIKKEADKTVFLYAKSLPLIRNGEILTKRGRAMRKHGFESFFKNAPSPDRMKESNPDTGKQNERFYLFLKFDGEKASKGITQQLYQLIILSIVLLLVGVGGWLSLLTLQGLRGSQSKLKSVEDFSDMLIRTMPVGIIAVKASGEVRVCNRVAAEMLGRDGKEIVGSSFMDVLDDRICKIIEKKKKKLSDFNKKGFEAIEIGTGDKIHEVMAHCLPVNEVGHGGKKEKSFMLILQDFTEINQLKQQLERTERLAALGKVAAGVAHELRNPLSSIKGLALLVSSKVSSKSDEEKQLHLMIKEIERLNRSITELLDFARQDRLDKSHYNMKAIIDDAVDLIESDASVNDIEIALDCDDIFLEVDGDKIKQIVLNILLNAVQAIEKKGIISVSLKLEDGQVVCRVTDTGKGIQPEILTKVFDPYFTTKSNGTGLGLALSTKIIEAHNGKIKIESDGKNGSTATFYLPAV